jgi:hypothetical protein
MKMLQSFKEIRFSNIGKLSNFEIPENILTYGTY